MLVKREIPNEVFEELDQVRKSGKVNMLDPVGVQILAKERGHDSLAEQLGEDPVEGYSELLNFYSQWLSKKSNG